MYQAFATALTLRPGEWFTFPSGPSDPTPRPIRPESATAYRATLQRNLRAIGRADAGAALEVRARNGYLYVRIPAPAPADAPDLDDPLT